MKFVQKSQRLLNYLYRISLIAKGIDSIIEIIGGGLLLFVSPRVITKTVLVLAHTELVEGSRHPLIACIIHIASDFSLKTRQFYSLLFLGHGAVKLFLVVGLVRNKMWAYPTTMLVFTFFIFYQAYEICISPSVMLGMITLIDVSVVLLIWREYNRTKKEGG